MKIVTDGALITVTCVCLENHTTKWRSSPVFHEGTKHPVGEINIVLAAYILTCGMHVKQVHLQFTFLSKKIITIFTYRFWSIFIT